MFNQLCLAMFPLYNIYVSLNKYKYYYNLNIDTLNYIFYDLKRLKL
jgi:hypothetical protein